MPIASHGRARWYPTENRRALGDLYRRGRTDLQIGSGKRAQGAAARMEINMKIDHPFFERQHDKSITIRGTVYMTLFGDARQRPFPCAPNR